MEQYFRALLYNKENGTNTVYRWSGIGKSLDSDTPLNRQYWWYNNFVGKIAKILYKNPLKVAWVGNLSDESKALLNAAWSVMSNTIEIANIVDTAMFMEGKYLINHTQMLYISGSDYKDEMAQKVIGISDEQILHPLPLLTALGNGKGDNDYHGRNQLDVGSWSYNVISVDDVPPNDDYEKINCFFAE